MGAWGILERQSDNGLDMLGLIRTKQLKKVDFTTFNVAEAIKLLNEDTQSEIERYQQKPASESTEFYINEYLMHNFTHAAVLVAECLAEYYQTGEWVVYDYVGEDNDMVERRVKDFIVTRDDLQSLLEVLRSVQDPEHWRYQCWVDDETCKRWLTHIQSVYQTLQQHYELAQEKPSIREKLQRQAEFIKAPQKGTSNTQERCF